MKNFREPPNAALTSHPLSCAPAPRRPQKKLFKNIYFIYFNKLTPGKSSPGVIAPVLGVVTVLLLTEGSL